MEMMIERRGDLEGRVPMHLPIELEFEGLQEPFEADAVDVSTGGLSLRASCLPEVGTQLACRFEAIAGGAQIAAHAEVVWTRLEGPRGGEFGLRFLSLSDQDRVLIAEMIAEQAARPSDTAEFGHVAPQATVEPARAGAPQAAVLALDAGPAEISGRLAERGAHMARFEQALDLLSVGEGLWLHAEDGRSRRAHIAGVSLRLEGKTPLLAVQVEFSEGETSVHGLSWQDDETMLARDTVPDLTPPDGSMDEPEGETVADLQLRQRTQVEFATPRVEVAARLAKSDSACDRPRSLARPVQVELPLSAATQASCIEEALNAASEATPVAGDSSAPVPSPEGGDDVLLDQEPPDARADMSMAFQLPLREEDGGELPAPPAFPRLRLPRTPRVSGAQFRAALRDSPLFQEGGAGLLAAAYLGRMTEQLRAGCSTVVALFRDNAGPFASVVMERARRATRGLMPTKPKRRTAGKAPQGARTHSALPLVWVGLLTLAALALLTYALWPEKDPLLSAPVTRGAPAPATAAPLVAQAVAHAEALPVAAEETAVPLPGSVPEGSPYSGSRAAAANAAPVESLDHATHFGAEQVKDAQRFVLRMSAPITSLKGMPDPGGFVVDVRGARSLDKAGPIAGKHKALAKSMILNEGNRAELTIRFAPGQQPRYRVFAQGAKLIIEVGR